MFSFILFRRNINYLLPRLLNIRKPDILPRIINCYDVHAYMPQHQYSASYVYIITVYISLYNILKDKISKVSNGAKIRNRYNQVPHLTQDTNGIVTNSQKTPQTRAKRSALSQQVTTKHI